MNFDSARKIAFLVVVLVPAIYFIRFGLVLDTPLSSSQEVWGQFGDFLGGVINPILSFITILLLLESIKCQNVANESLTNQLNINKKNEKLKVFENLFFNLISSQRELFSKFKIKVIDSNKIAEIYTAEAVDRIEKCFIEEIENGKEFDELKALYEQIDEAYGSFDLLRGFCITVYLVKEHLNEVNGFTEVDRAFYYEKLINLLEFSHIRLIATSLQFDNGKIIEKLKDNEFVSVCNRLGLNLFDPYGLKLNSQASNK
ncbi:hypothetical protein [Acinetobacter faecalis]|uniref:hypothetical protein n=1 Tax=Acinetobacter faecalis TaxID=2665161 RepID=UPI002A915B0A|nr:hypothetical protein [Acinetobacter faecalis]MDY6488447.1 hypothetical protein [Acinetobacter faecalis]